MIISLLRNLIPNRIRIIVQLVVVASMVILVDQILRAYAYDVSKELSIFIGLECKSTSELNLLEEPHFKHVKSNLRFLHVMSMSMTRLYQNGCLVSIDKVFQCQLMEALQGRFIPTSKEPWSFKALFLHRGIRVFFCTLIKKNARKDIVELLEELKIVPTSMIDIMKAYQL